MTRYEKKGKISIDNIFKQVYGGFDLNRKILTLGKTLSDEDYLEYFFGDITKVIHQEANNNSNNRSLPRNFDYLLKQMISIPNSTAYTKLLENIKNKYPTKKTDLVNSARELSHTMIEKNLNKDCYEYFGKVIAKNFSSPFYIQKAVEKACDLVLEEQDKMIKKEHEHYKNFYMNSVFDNNNFKLQITKRMINRFYQPITKRETSLSYKNRKQDDFVKIIDGSSIHKTKGLQAYISHKTTVEEKYKYSIIFLLRSLFKGEYLEETQTFIGDLIWCTTDKKKNMPFTFRK